MAGLYLKEEGVFMSRLRSVVVFLLCFGLLVACGGGTPTDSPNGGETPADSSDASTDSAPPAASGETVRQAFGGGPVGGAFQTFANALSLIIADADPNLELTAEGTGGSVENLRSVNSNDVQYGIVYAADMFLGREGTLPEDPTVYDSVRPVAALYGGVIHLVVTQSSGIQTVDDLPGKRIALGNAGSGAALSAERFFKHLGLYDQIQIEFLGYSQAAAAMGDGQLDGFWILAAFPNASVTEATTFTDIRLIDVYTPAVDSGFLDTYPFYSQRDLLGGAYEGLPDNVPSFQDTAIWVSNKDVSDDLVYNALQAVYSDEGLERMREAHPAAAEMVPADGVKGIPIPLHPGAYRYWQEIGAEVPDTIIPE
jgi:TRAP transporter TAXI family solute receptor